MRAGGQQPVGLVVEIRMKPAILKAMPAIEKEARGEPGEAGFSHPSCPAISQAWCRRPERQPSMKLFSPQYDLRHPAIRAAGAAPSRSSEAGSSMVAGARAIRAQSPPGHARFHCGKDAFSQRLLRHGSVKHADACRFMRRACEKRRPNLGVKRQVALLKAVHRPAGAARAGARKPQRRIDVEKQRQIRLRVTDRKPPHGFLGRSVNSAAAS